MINVDSNRLKIITARRVSNILLISFIYSSVLMPNDHLNIKKISFALLILFNINKIINTKEYFLLFMGTFFPTFLISLSILLGNNPYEAISIGYSGYYILLYFVIKNNKFEYKKHFLNSLVVMSLIIVFGVLFDQFGLISIYDNNLLQYLHITNNAMVGKGVTATTFGYMIFLKASPLILFLLVESIKRKYTLYTFLSLSGLFYSGTRANVFMTIFLLVFIILISKKNLIKHMLFIMLSFFLIIWLLYYIDEIIFFIENMFVSRQNNDIYRANQIITLFRGYKDNPIKLVFGTGFGSYIRVLSHYVNILEISYLDFLRQVGLIGLLPFSHFIISPMKYIRDKNFLLLLAYIGFLIISFTNPFLYSSTGYLVYIYIYLSADHISNNKGNSK